MFFSLVLEFGFDSASYSFSESDGSASGLTVISTGANIGGFFFIRIFAGTDDDNALATASGKKDTFIKFTSRRLKLLIFSAGVDYVSQAVGRGELELPLTSTTPSSSFSVNLIQNDLTELQESFFAIIRGYDVFDLSGNMLTLTSDERGRIRFGLDTAEIVVADSNSK